MPYIKSVCIAGKTKEVEKYYTRWIQPKGGSRQQRKKETTERQKKVNDRQTVKRLTIIINANFDNKCLYVTFSYTKEQRPDIETLKKHKKELLKKMRREYRKENKELKYIETAEIGERGAVHIHMIVNEINACTLSKLWKYGWIAAKPLDDSGQYRRLAEYFVKYFKKTRGTDEQIQKKAYNCSRNLKRPEPKKTIMKGMRFKTEIEVPKGWYLDKESVRHGINEEGYEFLFYMLIKEKGS